MFTMSAKIPRAVSAKLSKSAGSIKSASKQSNNQGGDGDRDHLKVRPKTAWKKSDLERVKVTEKLSSKKEKQQQIENQEAEIQRLELESQNRKKSLQELDMIRDEKLGRNYDPFAEERAKEESKLLDRALLAKHEQVNLNMLRLNSI